MSAPRDYVSPPVERAAASTRTRGQAAYEADVTRAPFYQDGTARRPWASLSEPVKQSWENNPSARHYANGLNRAIFGDQI